MNSIVLGSSTVEGQLEVQLVRTRVGTSVWARVKYDYWEHILLLKSLMAQSPSFICMVDTLPRSALHIQRFCTTP